MFELELYDRKGEKLSIGDTVKISDGRNFTFYAEVKYLEKEQVITPFHTFSFHSIEKVDSVPNHAKKSSEERYNIWYVCGDDAEQDEVAESFQDYLMAWRQCEHLLECWKIKLKP